jgi:hypothetical protein
MAAVEEVDDVGRTIEEETVCEKRERGEEAETLTPWEQHSSIISIPRFDYKAPSSLLHHSHSGFLVTCNISMIFFTILFCIILFSFYVLISFCDMTFNFSNSFIVSEFMTCGICVLD